MKHLFNRCLLSSSCVETPIKAGTGITENKTKSVFMESAIQGLREGQKKKLSRRGNKCPMYHKLV